MDKILALDLGTTTVGVAVGRLAMSLFLRVLSLPLQKSYRYARKKFCLFAKKGITTIVLITHLTLMEEGERAKSVKRFKSDLLSECPNLEIILVDERYSTLEAKNA